MGFLLIAVLGGFTGLRTMTPIAVLCWFAYLQHVQLAGWRGFAAYLVSVILFSAGALGEYVGDKLPRTPGRIAPVGLSGRSAFGGFCGVLLAPTLSVYWPLALVAGVAGALIGSYTGYFARTRTVAALKSADWPVAVVEDAVAIAGSIVTLHLVESVGVFTSLR